jgi:hypothetical protein
MHAFNMNLVVCFLCALSVQQIPMAFAARPLKGTRGGVQHARTLQDELRSSEESGVDSPSSADDNEDMPSSADSEDSKGRVAGPSKRDCKMCKFQN